MVRVCMGYLLPQEELPHLLLHSEISWGIPQDTVLTHLRDTRPTIEATLRVEVEVSLMASNECECVNDLCVDPGWANSSPFNSIQSI